MTDVTPSRVVYGAADSPPPMMESVSVAALYVASYVSSRTLPLPKTAFEKEVRAVQASDLLSAREATADGRRELQTSTTPAEPSLSPPPC